MSNLRATTMPQTAVAMHRSALAKTDHTAVHEIPHLAFSLETGDMRGRLRGKSCQVKTMSYQACKSARCSQQLHINHSPVATIYLVTTPRNTADLIARPLPAFGETGEGQESHHPGTEDKRSELNGNLTGQE